MGIGDIFGSVKDRLLGRKSSEDLDDIRSYVTGGGDQYRQSLRESVGGGEDPPMDAPPKPWERENIAAEPPEPDNPFEARRDLSTEPIRGSRSEANYDMMEKLTMIESQLAAIRSQTETINERLKNLEFRMGSARRF